MNTRALLSIVSTLFLFSCSNDFISTEPWAIRTACAKCGMSAVEMRWLAVRIQEAKDDVTKSGNFYAVPTSEGVVIIQQPVIMSCLGCLRFDCHGITPTLSESVIKDELIQGMNSGNLIYEMQ